jgi:HlyD family secretion protein
MSRQADASRWGEWSGPRALAAAALALAAVGGLAFLWRAAAPRTEPIEVAAPPPAVVGLGYLEPASTVVRVGAAGGTGAMAAKIGTLAVAEGEMVAAGQVLATLDTVPRLAAQMAASEAQVRLKRLQFERQRVDLASTLAARRAARDRARAEFVVAKGEYERQRALLSNSVVSRASYDRALRDYVNEMATGEETDAAFARIAATVAGPDGAPGMQIDLAVTQAELASAEADLAVARASLAEAIIRAPFAGRILSLKARAGEQIGSDGLLEMGDVAHMRAVVEVYQTDIARVAVDASVLLRADALPVPIRGRVERIGAAVQRQTVVNNDPAAATDARVVPVFVALDAEASRMVAGLSRLQVQAVFSR